jgi:lysyl-tRNA synthetase class 1
MPLFWAEQLARRAIARAKREKTAVTCRSGQSPSGAKHIGNINDNIRSYFVAKIVADLGYKSRHVQTHDDLDPLRTVPRKLVDLDGRWHEISKEQVDAFSKYLGLPYVTVPDIFGCCGSWAEHFESVWEAGCAAIGMRTQYFRNSVLYRQGKFLPYMLLALKRIDRSREIIMRFQRTKTWGYIPLDIICENCGKVIGRPIEFDIPSQTVKYACDTKELAGKYEIRGCGHRAEADFANCKLPWRFEWPAAWGIFKTTFEPFGKEHFEGSWPSGRLIARDVYGIEPPIELVYEFFLIDGKKISARLGNAYIVQDMLQIIEPEVFLYFYTKRPAKQRELAASEIFRLVDEFDWIERAVFGKERVSKKELANFKAAYALSMRKLPERQPVRIPYTFAAMIAQTVPEQDMLARAISLLRSTGHIKAELTEPDKRAIERRLRLAKVWARTFAAERYRFKLLAGPTPAEITRKLTVKQKAALKALATLLLKELTVQELYAGIFEIAREQRISPPELFKAAYLVLLGKDHGPRLAPFILAIGRNEVAKKFASL